MFRCALFNTWSSNVETRRSQTVPSVVVHDWVFREITFAALCLAAGGTHMTLLPHSVIDPEPQTGYQSVRPAFRATYDTAFVSDHASGFHVLGVEPGSCPKDAVYRFQGVVVFHVSVLDQAGTLQQGLSDVTSYCRDNYSNEYVDALLLSIDHVVIIHVIPGEEIQHSALLPFLDSTSGRSVGLRNPITADHLDRLIVQDKD